MKYIDRKSIALERFFANRSDMLSHLDDFTEEALREAAQELFPLKRNMLSAVICDSLKHLDSSFRIREYIPEDLLKAAELPLKSFISEGYFTEFLLWLRKLQLNNAQARVPWESSLKTAACRLKPLAGTFLRSFFALSNQRIFITLDGSTLTVTPAEREWGHAVIHFLGCQFDSPPPMPLPGFSVAAEADLSDSERIGFSILIDTRFSNLVNDFSDRLLSDDGWQTVCFSCSDIRLDADFTDYAERMRFCGTSKADAVFECCRILLNKRLLVGIDGLNPKERMMMPVAGLIGALHAPLSKKPADFADWQYDDIILDTLSNRCDIQSFITSLKKCSCSDLADIMEKAAGASFDDLDTEALAYARKFSALLHRKVINGTARPLMYWLYAQFCEMSALNTGSTAKTTAERSVLSKIEKLIIPKMTELGFTGKYPDFQRSGKSPFGKERMEYITFTLCRSSERLLNGIESYSASVAAAELNGDRMNEYEKFGVFRKDTSALDCAHEKTSYSHFGEICCSDDFGPAIFELNFYSGTTAEPVRNDYDKLTACLPIIEHQFARGHLPADYHRKFSLWSAAGSYIRSLAYFLPFTVILAIALLSAYVLFGEKLPVSTLSPTAASAAILGICFLFDCIAGAVRCLVCSKKLWHY